VQKTGFSPVDGTKNAAPVGIMPGAVFFIGASRTITVTEAGTLFLGINDCEIGDNSWGFNVTRLDALNDSVRGWFERRFFSVAALLFS
jgi:hypothetical protein